MASYEGGKRDGRRDSDNGDRNKDPEGGIGTLLGCLDSDDQRQYEEGYREGYQSGKSGKK